MSDTFSEKADVVLIGAGIMSATVGTFLKELEPSLDMVMFETLRDCAQESSHAWNNAGTGHAANCELNYTPQRADGSIDISKALEVNTEFDLWLSRRLFLILPAFEFYKDPFQNINRRFTVGGGLGYDIFARPNLEWSVTAGPAYQHTWFESVQAGEPPDRGTAAMTFGTRFDWQITRRIGFILEYRGQYTDREVGETFHHTVATLELDLTKRFELDVSLVWDRIQSPQPESNGTIPKQDDLRLVVGLGVRF